LWTSPTLRAGRGWSEWRDLISTAFPQGCWRIEIVFYRLGDDIYLSGIPASKRRDWLANLAARPEFTFHLKHGVVADLPATAAVITDSVERRQVLAVLVDQFNDRHGADSSWPTAVLDDWVEHSPLAKVTLFDDGWSASDGTWRVVPCRL
jgi:hypothetical protein